MALYTCLVPKREDWQKLRDGATPKVPKGAVMSVSIGDDIAKVYEAFNADLVDKGIEKTEKLIKDLDKYKEAIKKKYAHFVPSVEKVKKKAGDHLKVLQDIRTAKAQLPNYVGTAQQTHFDVKAARATTKELAKNLLEVKGRLDCIGLINDEVAKLARTTQGFVNLLENQSDFNKLTDKQRSDLDELLRNGLNITR